jgi:hypothetical protein
VALTTEQRRALIQAEQAARQQIRERLQNYANIYWTELGSWRDADIERFVESLVPRVQAGQIAVAQITDAYLAAYTDSPAAGVIDLSNTRGGVTLEEVYHRPATQLYTELSSGKPFNIALDIATARLLGLIATDLQLAMTHQAQTSNMGGRKMYQRTLTGRENCALCTIASTQRYYVKKLMPIHPGCDCGIAPYTGEDVQIINEELLEATHSAIDNKLALNDRGARNLGLGKTTSQGKPISDFTDLIVTQSHGEYGPTLAWRGHAFTGPQGL